MTRPPSDADAPDPPHDAADYDDTGGRDGAGRHEDTDGRDGTADHDGADVHDSAEGLDSTAEYDSTAEHDDADGQAGGRAARRGSAGGSAAGLGAAVSSMGAGAGVPSVRAVRRRLRRARSAHRDTTLGAILTDAYIVAMAVAIYGALAVTAIRRHLRLPAATSPAEAGVRGWLLVAVVLVLGGLVWHALRDLGPLYVTAAGRYWAAGTPVDRAGWLRPALGWAALTGAAGGALCGIVVVLLSPSGVGPSTGWALAAAAGAGAALPLFAVVAQAAAVPRATSGAGPAAHAATAIHDTAIHDTAIHDTTRAATTNASATKRHPVTADANAADRPPAASAERSAGGNISRQRLRRASRRAPGQTGAAVVAGVGFAVALCVVALDAWGVRVPGPAVPLPVRAVAGGGLAVVAAVSAWRQLGRLDAAALGGGAQLADAATVSLVLLQPAMFSDIIEIRRWRRVGSVHSGPLGPPPGLVARRDGLRRLWTLVRADLRRQRRRPAGVLAWAGLLVVPYAMTLVAPGGAAPARVVAGYLATERLCAGLRTVCRSDALRRLLGGSDRALRAGHLVVPAIGVALWWPATLPSVTGVGLFEPLLGLGVLAAAYRAATRRPTRYDGAAVDTPFGIIQPDLVTQIVRGPDLVAALALAAFALS